MSECGNPPKSLVADGQPGVAALRGRGVPVLDVERVERFEAKLQRHSFAGQGDALEQRDIHVVNGAPSERVAPEIPKGA